MITIRNLVFQYEPTDFCLTIPALHIAAGSKVAIIGPSGAGKTTLLSLLAGIFLPTQGEITVHGLRLHTLSDAERRAFRIARVGFVFQDFALLDYLSVVENILLPYRLHRILRLTSQVRAQAVALAAQVGLQDKLQRSCQQLSQGEKQRVALCRALLTRPPLILADEATGNLDPGNTETILQLLCQHVDTSQATLIAVTHDQSILTAFDTIIDLQHLCQSTAYAT